MYANILELTVHATGRIQIRTPTDSLGASNRKKTRIAVRRARSPCDVLCYVRGWPYTSNIRVPYWMALDVDLVRYR